MSENRIIELENEVELLNNKLADNFLKTVRTLSNVISLNEKYHIGSHSRFVAKYSTILSEKVGLEEHDILEVKIAALLHDIGEIGFSENIMRKFPIDMTDEEFETYRKHPFLGVQILKNYEHFSKISEIIYQHHEILNGKGFPRGLKEDEITIGAKIIAVPDFFHNEVYKNYENRESLFNFDEEGINTQTFIEKMKKSYSPAIDYLKENKAVVFDKEVVESFLEIIDEEVSTIESKKLVKLSVEQLTVGMILAYEYYSGYGNIIASRCDKVTESTIKMFRILKDKKQISEKVLVLV